jgi:hypothetical protein
MNAIYTARRRLTFAWVIVSLVTIGTGMGSFAVASAIDNWFAYSVAAVITVAVFNVCFKGVERAHANLEALYDSVYVEDEWA